MTIGNLQIITAKRSTQIFLMTRILKLCVFRIQLRLQAFTILMSLYIRKYAVIVSALRQILPGRDRGSSYILKQWLMYQKCILIIYIFAVMVAVIQLLKQISPIISDMIRTMFCLLECRELRRIMYHHLDMLLIT